MKAHLHHAIINTKIKEGFLVQHNGTFKIVDKCSNGTVTFCNGDTEEEGILESSVVKLLAVVSGNTPYSIFNADYDKVLDILSEPNETYASLHGYLDQEPVELQGHIERKTINVKIGDSVRITAIKHIDKHSLYDYASRVFTVTDYKDYYFHLRQGAILIKCKREDFSPMTGENLRSFFQIKCTHCGR